MGVDAKAVTRLDDGAAQEVARAAKGRAAANLCKPLARAARQWDMTSAPGAYRITNGEDSSPPQPMSGTGVYSAVAALAPLDADAGLMLRVRDGETSCFNQLLERHRSPVVHFLFRMVQNQAIAEELAQDVFLRVYRSRGRYEPSAKFSTWLFRIATNLAFNWIRDHKNLQANESLEETTATGLARQLPDRGPNVESRLLLEAKLAEVRDAIEKLPEKQRAAVLMHKYEEMEYSQIARVLGCSESAVKSLLFRAYESLRARLAKYAG